MEIVVYVSRCIFLLLVTWLGIRLIGKKSISQMTSYELACMMILSNVAAEPLVYKIASKASIGVIALALGTVLVAWISLRKTFYNFDSRPSLLIVNGKIDQKELQRNRMNLPFLLSLLREKGYASVSDVEFALLEPTGNLSIIPKSQTRPVTPKDLNIKTKYEGLSLPLIIDGEIQRNNLKYAKLSLDWLHAEMEKAGASSPKQLFLAELDTQGNVYFDFYKDDLHQPSVI